MNLLDYFDRIVLINLKRRPDRLEDFWGQLEKHGWPFRKPEVFEAVDGSIVPTPPGWKGGGGAWGCCQSHRRILELALHDKIEHILVLEDDACMMTNFVEDVTKFIQEVPQDFHGLMLGGQHHRKPTLIKPGIVRCSNCQRTHAYSARGSYLRDLYAMWCSPSQRTHIDHTMGPFHAKYKIYAPDPFLFGQSRSQSDINCRVNPTKFWNAPSGEEPIVLLHAPQKVAEALAELGFHRGYDRDPRTDIDRGLQSVFAKRRTLDNWITEIQWECTSEEGWLVTVWHPDATLGMIREAWKGPVVEITANTVQEALDQRPQLKSMPPKRKPIVLLQAPRQVALQLPWHRGYWRDSITDVDNGLRKAIEADGDLEEVVRVLLQEAEDIQDGVACLWYPPLPGHGSESAPILTLQRVQEATLWPVVEIVAKTVDEALEKWKELK